MRPPMRRRGHHAGTYRLYLPLATNDGLPVTQFNMTEIEELGLLKMDFLGLRTLTVIRDAETAVQKHHPEFSIQKLDL